VFFHSARETQGASTPPPCGSAQHDKSFELETEKSELRGEEDSQFGSAKKRGRSRAFDFVLAKS
jgi:hypothetical protein